MTLDYFYGQAGELFSFYRIPKALFQEPRFQSLSTDAKTLYGILLDRMSLSAKNGWLDEQGRVFIIFTIEDVKRALCCADNKATKLLRELEEFGLIERKRRGLGKPSLVYVKNFSAESSKSIFQNRDFHDSGGFKSASQDPAKPRCNKTEENNTEMSETYPFYSEEEDGMSKREQLEEYFSQSLEVDTLLRLCPDDEDTIYQMSISNQKLMLKDFAEKNGMFRYEYYVDDGYTGRNFNRPAFQRMIADIEAGKIDCVITKDLSRLGRNYIEAGSYIEIFFPKHHVRYIAITDGVDSLTRQEMDITPFKNILNDMYSRDISKKVLAGVMTRSRQGKFCGGTPPYGLMRDPKDNGHLIIDPDAAPIIRKIYDYALDGMGNMRIAKKLLEEKIPITRVKANTALDANYYTWGTARIGHILRNPFYKGAHLVCRTHQTGIRSGSFKFIPREEWEVIENCHEAIVTPEE